MKKFFVFLILLLTVSTFSRANKADFLFPNKGNAFIQNQGQWPETVLFLLQSPGLNTWITKTGVVFDYYEVNQVANEKGFLLSGIVKGQVIKMEYHHLLSDTMVSTKERSITKYNYFKGKDPAKWAADIPAFGRVTIHNVFHKIDMEFSVENGMPRYDFIVNKGGNPNEIKLALSGAQKAEIKENQLALKTQIGVKNHGDITAFQQGNPVSCHPIVNNNVFGFNVTGYNPDLPLRIDPLVYSTFFGGSSEEAILTITLDENENIYAAGYSWSADFPVTSGAYQHDLIWMNDAIISGFSPDGKTLLFSTYLGGDFNDYVVKMAYNDNLILYGVTTSDDFPVSADAFQTESNLGGDVFVASINTSGNTLNFSTYVGGSGKDMPTSLDVKDGNILAGGYTNSQDFPIVGNAVKNQYTGDGFLDDGFFFLLNSEGTELNYSTYYGGYYEDQINAVAFNRNNSNSLYIAGQTMSADFPYTKNAFDTIPDTDHADAFITKFDSLSIKYSTFLGGSSYDVCNALTVDNHGSIIAAGFTYSNDFPVTANAFMNAHQLLSDGFLVRLNPDGIAGTDDLQYGTYFGGAGDESVSEIVLTTDNRLYIAGTTNSFNFPTTSEAEYTEQIGNMDGYLMRFNMNNATVDYSTYFGGSFDDGFSSLVLKANHNVVLGGETVSFNFPVTADAYSGTITNENYPDAILSILDIVPTSIVENKTSFGHVEHNHPNPFSHFTTIPYQLSAISDVLLQITNESGQLVFSKTEKKKIAGKHTFLLDANRFSSGIYFYTITTAQWSETGKMVVQ